MKVDLEKHADPHTVAGLLKLYFRDTPEPLLTEEGYEDWISAAGNNWLEE